MHTLLWIKHPGHCRWRTARFLSLCGHPKWHHATWIFSFLLQSLHLLSGPTQIHNGSSGESVSLPEQTASHPEKPTTCFSLKKSMEKERRTDTAERYGTLTSHASQDQTEMARTRASNFPNFGRNTFLDVSVGISLLICGAAGVLWKIQKRRVRIWWKIPLN